MAEKPTQEIEGATGSDFEHFFRPILLNSTPAENCTEEFQHMENCYGRARGYDSVPRLLGGRGAEKRIQPTGVPLK